MILSQGTNLSFFLLFSLVFFNDVTSLICTVDGKISYLKDLKVNYGRFLATEKSSCISTTPIRSRSISTTTTTQKIDCRE